MEDEKCAFCGKTPATNPHKIWNRRDQVFRQVKLCDTCYQVTKKSS